MGGSIKITSKEGQGSIFTFSIVLEGYDEKLSFGKKNDISNNHT